MTIDHKSEHNAAPEQDGRNAAWEALDERAGRPFRGRAARRGRYDERGGERVPLDDLDIMAFIIAFFQLLLPPALIMVGVLVLLYLLLRLWAGA